MNRVQLKTLSQCRDSIRASSLRFYVYLLADAAGVPFYVGCGSAGRIARHEKEARRSRSAKAAIIRKLWRAGESVQYAICSWWPSWDDAAAAETRLIAEIGRIDLGTGPLTNLTAGGQGFVELGLDAVAKKRLAMLRRWQDPAYRLKMSDQARAFWAANDTAKIKVGEKIRATRAAKGLDASHGQLIRKKWSTDPEYRRSVVASIARRTSAEDLSRMRSSRWAKSGARARQSKQIAEKQANAEFRARCGEAVRKALQSPEVRAKMCLASRQRWADPAFRDKVLAARRAARLKLKRAGS